MGGRTGKLRHSDKKWVASRFFFGLFFATPFLVAGCNFPPGRQLISPGLFKNLSLASVCWCGVVSTLTKGGDGGAQFGSVSDSSTRSK